jgi:macrolide transport system ATP-binding/permease protein
VRVNLSVDASDRVALIGDNGAGKTTLLKLVAGELSPDSGAIKSGGDIGVVAQYNNFSGSVGEFLGGLESWRVDVALDKVGLSALDLRQAVLKLSGGQKTRLSLAKILAEENQPEILLLDEPTNNLDGDGLEWLADFLKTFGGQIIFASHDRHFIDAVATKIWEIDDGQVHTFNGNYTFYREQKTVERKRQQELYDKVEKEKRKLLNLRKIANERNNTASHQHFDKLHTPKKLGNLKTNFNAERSAAQSAQGKAVRVIDTKLAQLSPAEKPLTQKIYRANLSSEPTHDKIILHAENLTKKFSGRTIFEDVSFELRAGQRLQIAGPNGGGKTTLLSITAGRLNADSGTIWRAPDLRTGYLSQDVINLDFAESGLENLRTIFDNQTEIFASAAAMDLSPNDLMKPVGKLSRGQQTKLGVLKLLLGHYDLIILDEPTNHLDIRARENIEQALVNFTGAVLLATHDKRLTERLNIDAIIALEP